MVLGASPSAPSYFEIPDVDVIASAGAAILLYRPDWYFIFERDPLWLHEDRLKDARANGTKVVVNGGWREYIKKTKGEDYEYPCDEWIDDYCYGGVFNSHRHWTPGIYAQTVGGCLALQWAVNHGAKEVHIVGLEGYTGEVDYFTGERGNATGLRLTRKGYGPLMQKIISLSPDIQFIVYGELKYPLDGDNVSLVQGRPNSAPTLSRGFSQGVMQ
jgi:hypothetical protein